MSAIKSLERKIFIRNEFNRIAAPLIRFALEASKPFVGKKINTLKGLAAKYHDALKIDRESIEVRTMPGMEYAKLHSFYVSARGGDLTVEIQLMFSKRLDGCEYEKNTYYIGKVSSDGTLEKLHHDVQIEFEPLDFKTELEKIKRFRELEAIAKEAEDLIRVYRSDYDYINLDDFEREK